MKCMLGNDNYSLCSLPGQEAKVVTCREYRVNFEKILFCF